MRPSPEREAAGAPGRSTRAHGPQRGTALPLGPARPRPRARPRRYLAALLPAGGRRPRPEQEAAGRAAAPRGREDGAQSRAGGRGSRGLGTGPRAAAPAPPSPRRWLVARPLPGPPRAAPRVPRPLAAPGRSARASGVCPRASRRGARAQRETGRPGPRAPGSRPRAPRPPPVGSRRGLHARHAREALGPGRVRGAVALGKAAVPARGRAETRGRGARAAGRPEGGRSPRSGPGAAVSGLIPAPAGRPFGLLCVPEPAARALRGCGSAGGGWAEAAPGRRAAWTGSCSARCAPAEDVPGWAVGAGNPSLPPARSAGGQRSPEPRGTADGRRAPGAARGPRPRLHALAPAARGARESRADGL